MTLTGTVPAERGGGDQVQPDHPCSENLVIRLSQALCALL